MRGVAFEAQLQVAASNSIDSEPAAATSRKRRHLAGSVSVPKILRAIMAKEPQHKEEQPIADRDVLGRFRGRVPKEAALVLADCNYDNDQA